ncbi:MAG: universal stress protein [Proteobacteria bacterium]|nr:universal stress protein [Pseudomonadota bacterium]MBU4297342.1 universal stress protein [Pseudomonadota bacterium]MCG2748959.1 universal stress protein [Desulfobulbaceae bacterium]
MQVKKILVPVDFSENSNRIIKYGASVASQFGAEMEAIFVAQTFQDYSEFFEPHMPVIQFEEDLVASARERMKAFLAESLEPAVVCKGVVMAGDIAETIRNYAREQKVDLIVMGTHGYKGLEKVLFGSIAEKLVKNSPCPVLTINPYK